jgi:rhodanese-related sulfurtransferase
VPSKTFGELLEHKRHTPRITAEELHRLMASGEPFVIVDGRPFSEYQKMNIPGGICCPNGELALRIGEIVPDPSTTIVVNCAGRTRSIIGAETLIALGVPNPVMALENGTLDLVDRAADRTVQVSDMTLRGEMRALSGPFRLEGEAHAFGQRHGIRRCAKKGQKCKNRRHGSAAAASSVKAPFSVRLFWSSSNCGPA